MNSIKLQILVKPNSRQEMVDCQGELVTCRVNAPPADGKANLRVIELLAKALGVGRTKIVLLHGHTSKNKLLEIFTEMSREEVLRSLKKGRESL